MPAGRRFCRAYHTRPRKGVFLFLGAKKSAYSHIYTFGMSTGGKYVTGDGFYVKAGDLKAALGRFKHVITKKSPDSILGRLLMYQTKDRLELHGSDGKMYATFIMDVKPTWELKVGVRMAVPYKLLTDFLKDIPDEAVLACKQAHDEKHIPFLLVESDNSYQFFHGIDPSNFPPPPRWRPDNIVLMDEDAFRDMVAKTIFAAADDREYPNLSGVYFDFLPDRTNFVATNRSILSVYTRTDLEFGSIKNKPKSIIVPTKVLNAFMAGIKGLPRIEKVLIYPFDEHILLAHRGFFLASKLISGEYPDYQRVIPTETPHVAFFERGKLYKAVKRLASTVNTEMPVVEFIFSGDGVELCASNAQQGGGGKEKMVCKYAGDALKVSFSADLLLSILENIKSERVVMRIAGSTRPVIIEPEPQDMLSNMLCLIAPLAGE